MEESILALDVGERKIGVARAHTIAKIAEPLTTLPNDELFAQKLTSLITEHNAKKVIVGLPRDINGNETAQTRYARKFAEELGSSLKDVTIVLQDEAVTSIKAEGILKTRGKSYTKGDIDSVAAMLILEDYLVA